MVDSVVPQASREAEPSSPQRSRINVVLFSGGTGTRSITEALVRHPQISLQILINAYDDGHSTGRLRRFIPSMLGPSDVRKNVNRLMPSAERSQQALRFVSDYRLPVGIPRAEALRFLEDILEGREGRLPRAVAEALERLTVSQARQLHSFLRTFCDYFHRREAAGQSFDFTDCAVGNLLFAGCFLQQGEDFNRAVEAFCRFYEVPPHMLLNVTQGENLYLVALKEDGTVLRSEAEIVSAQSTARIAELFLLDAGLYRQHVENGAAEPPEGWAAFFRQAYRVPQINPRAREALLAADVIIYGPGTQHSSLFPSYMTEGVAEAIMANRQADKIFVGNIRRDYDIQQEDANELARKFMHAMSRKGQIAVNWPDVVSHFFLQHPGDETGSEHARYIPFDHTTFPFPLETVRLKDWESEAGGHGGGFVLDEVRQIVQSRIDVELEQVQHMVSILVPVLNEERTLEGVLKSLTALDFQPLGLTKEIIVVDGGSTDKSVEIARSIRNVRVFRLERPRGRGAALRLGLEKARGNIVVFFPGDAEYMPEDLYTLVTPLLRSRFRAVFGTRAVTCASLTEQLKQIYQKQWGLYLASKYGGMLLSVVTLLLYNRYVSDVLSSVKAFDASLLRSLALESNGRDLETEIVAKLARRREYILELPVDYKPRTRAAGKKITVHDGLAALAALVRYRFRG
ncbi:MAG: 2-phospho-L-lactate transferase CofD family protein [Bryobacterales bacterium]|nr:2-phospho-L-lactate transferase CofD family protein [Bryobacterales bacterium]